MDLQNAALKMAMSGIQHWLSRRQSYETYLHLLRAVVKHAHTANGTHCLSRDNIPYNRHDVARLGNASWPGHHAHCDCSHLLSNQTAEHNTMSPAGHTQLDLASKPVHHDLINDVAGQPISLWWHEP